ncbi:MULTISPECIES: LLM class flavin-dependent oxidoreductase [unclassified Mesorhizobium]|uniref:LLM class flavin-dependent oxidoreductase n=1 Tax=unclassified Mesorhizobium TaxID=325217 RepID=UPI000FCB2D89|nr:MULTISPECIES: LLM class flavin-dependent oxidoreductase [unclassified Mesorhizobium]TGP25309.1 LLM class flavin-dependent oxidoreductase [Mesorhizobium sp. M1D.F.Ca.ET.231.01.1.1]TGP36635.1 LLM class flavin-dependent oxidoreductase [Mesorhizobium sp. M1D.F.Ca.ET.234.01.1.1]TGS50136.1 LLM class flavin-dependent oxidoreductase [Mesorhizobium sp. M1D.F.Ca.ET.184.01.1.1]TGS64847.1 LLM class flavin-dependent oxidoreductase [Mesorhizobium sp. M1D.F.Ca.ET.183.01.1.1]
MGKKQMKLGLSMRYMGYHVGAWRHPDTVKGGNSMLQSFLGVAQTAERAKFDMLFLADGIGVRLDDKPKGSLCRSHHNVELEPLTLLSALAALTRNIGLVATASTTYNEPFHIARKYGSLDQISGGRAAWNVVTSWSDQEAWNFSMSKQLDYDTRYERAAEFVDVVTGLWDSWDEDAFVIDKESGIFFDDRKMHVLDHVGKHFSVRGPLSVRRSPQGRPILVQAGVSEPGQQIAAEYCDMVFMAKNDLKSAQDYYSSVKNRLDGFGRQKTDLLMMLGLTPIVGRTREEAQEKYEELESLIDPVVGLQLLYRSFGDLSHLPLDGPVPKPDLDKVGLKSSAQMYYELAQKQNLTIRQLYKKLGMAQEHKTVVGTAKDVADEMESWFEAGAADGFNITPTHLPQGIDDFVELVLPELRRRGLFRDEYEGRTLRENLGLPLPKSRYDADASAVARLAS